MKILDKTTSKTAARLNFQAYLASQAVANGMVAGSPIDDWVQKLGKNEQTTLPSGTIFLSGAAAQNKFDKIADFAASIPERQQEGSLPRGFETLQGFVDENSDRKLLGVYGNMPIICKKGLSATAQSKLLADTLKSLEEGQKRGRSAGIDLMAGLQKGEGKFPIVVYADDGFINQAIHAETVRTNYKQNFDAVLYNPYMAMRIKSSGRYRLPWIGLYHELQHAQQYKTYRDQSKAYPSVVKDYPDGNIFFSIGKYLDTATIDKDRKLIPKDAEIANVDEYEATEFEKRLSQQANNLPARKTYLDVEEYGFGSALYAVEDPVAPKSFISPDAQRQQTKPKPAEDEPDVEPENL